ncbi:MAG: FAD-dependent oxidoreductase [Dehalococcoidia bacterium]|nr:FAD-dependent oxidoreductase [Dehalococcoidia bacterium]
MASDRTAVAQPQRCVVIGGGLAGLSAALDLLDAGHAVTLVERRPFLGGRAYSFTDQDTGQEVDNGQHVFLGCCTAYRALLERLGAQGRTSLQPWLSVPVVGRNGVRSTLAAVPWLPFPLHLLPALLSYRHLSLRERLTTLRVLLVLMRTDRERRHADLESQSFKDWLLARGERPRSIQRFWNLIILPTLNDDVGAVSAAMGIMVFQEALLHGKHGGEIGYSRVGLTALVSDPAKAVFERAGGRLLLGQGAVRLGLREGRVDAVELSGGHRVEGDLFVSAVPWEALLKLLPEPWPRDLFFAPAATLEAAPIVGVHLWYDRAVMDDAFAAFLDTPVQWVFNKSSIMGLSGPGQYVCISLSGAWEFAPMSKEELRTLFVEEMARLFPKAREAKVERFIVVKQLSATFRSKPGAASGRLAQQTPIANLFLAGDWTETGWPSTMESAVRSGKLAAGAALRHVPSSLASSLSTEGEA